jgi:hypothetical protein
MRRLIFLALILSANLSYLWADSGDDKFYIMAEGCVYKNGSLEIDPYADSILWLNGIRQSTHDDVPGPITMKPGDILITGSPWFWDDGKPKHANYRDFCRYRLDKLTAQRAYFTWWIYSSIRTQLDEKSWKYQPGTLQFTEKFEIDLTQPHGLLIDYGWNHLELSWQTPSRSK